VLASGSFLQVFLPFHPLGPCSEKFSSMPSISLHCNLPYTYPSSYLPYIYVQFLFTMHFNTEDGAAQSSEMLVSNCHITWHNNPENHKF
jgi:hypothetical protein